MLIRFFNPNDLIGCGGDINQSDSFRYMEGVHRRVCGGGMQRGYMEGYAEGYAEGVCRGVHKGGMWRWYAEGVQGGGMWRG